MKKVKLLILLLSFVTITNAQQVQWLRSTTVAYSMNPQLPRHYVEASGNNIFAARLDSSTVNFGSDIYGVQNIDCYDSSGTFKWTFPFGPEAYVSEITSDQNGNVYVGGLFMGTFYLNGTDSLLNTGSGFDTNLFLFCLDSTGNLQWKRNLAILYPTFLTFTALNCDKNNSCWYVMQDFMNSKLIRVDNSGNDVQTIDVSGTRITSSISFDADNNMYLAGSTEMGTMSFDTITEAVTESYMMFIARINSAGHASWLKLAHDVTFQRPQVVATINGDAFFSCPLLDSISWGNIQFHHPQWVYDFFITRVDSFGNFHFGIQVPLTPSIAGDFYPGAGKFIDTDASGNCYLIGNVRGSVDWGNNVVSASGSIPLEIISVVSFDYSGQPRWAINGGSPGTNFSFNVSVSSNDHLYFSLAGQDTIAFDTLSVNIGNGYAACFGKIAPLLSTGINSNMNDRNFNIFPNPVSGKNLFVKNQSGSTGLFEIFDSTGRKLLSKKIDRGFSDYLVLENYRDGIFFYRFLSDNNSELAGKFIVTN